MQLARTLVKGSALRTASNVVQIALAIVITPVIVRSLGDRDYGLWILVGALMGYYGLLDLGFHMAVGRVISRAVGRSDTAEINAALNTALILFSGIGLAVLLLTVVAVMVCGHFLPTPEERSLMRSVIALMGVRMALGFPVRVFGSVVTAHLRYDLDSYAQLAQQVVTNLAIFVLLKDGHGILALAWTNLLTGLMQYAMIIVFAWITFPQMKFQVRLYRRELVRTFFSFGFFSFLPKLSTIVHSRASSYVVAAFVSVKMVTYYSIGARLCEYFMQVVMAALGLMMPVFSQHEGREDFDAIRDHFVRVTKLSVIVVMFIGTSMLFYGRSFITAWLGTGFDASYEICAILTVPFMLDLMQTNCNMVLLGTSRHAVYAYLCLAESIANLALSLLLARRYGIHGVAWATAVTLGLRAIAQGFFVCHLIKLRYWTYFVEALLVTILKAGVPLALYYAASYRFLRPAYPAIFAIALLQTALFAPVCLLWVIDPSTKRALLGLLPVSARGWAGRLA